MEIKQLIPGQTKRTLLYETYYIKEPASIEALVDTYKTYRDNNPGKTVLLTLDDLGQAEYTSTHATINYNLDDTEGHDLTGIDAACFEDGDHLGYLSTPSEFYIRKANFLKQAQAVSFSDSCAKGMTIDEDEIELLEAINENPLSYIQQQLLLKIVPVERSYEAISGFPNGYFTADLNPFENYALARHLSEKYGFELLGIGASLLGFIRETPLEAEQAAALIADLAKLYNTAAEELRNLQDQLEENELLFLKYVETLES